MKTILPLTLPWILRTPEEHQGNVYTIHGKPHRWRGRTSGDVGLLNDAYIASRLAFEKARVEVQL